VSAPGVRIAQAGTLVERVLRHLDQRSADSLAIARDVLGLTKASRAIAERVAVALLGADPRVRRLQDGRWALAGIAADAARLEACTFAVVDVETTGASAGNGDRVTEIAIYTLCNGRVEPVLETLVDPERPIPRYVSQLTRITDEMVRGQPTFADVADQVADALAGRIFAAHNARFDWAFLARELQRTRHVEIDGPRVCTVQLTRRLVPGLRSRGLDSVAQYFGVEIADRHRAAGDAKATAVILSRLLGLAADRGVGTLEELQQLGRRPRPRRTAFPTSTDES
jgi:DNA polymerase III epsilon subunit family exonuclease